MISFDLSNGHPYGPLVPTTSDDDQYVEYQLDDLTGFPSSAEEEERVSQLDVTLTLSKYPDDMNEEMKIGLYFLHLSSSCYSDAHGSSDGVTEGPGSTKSKGRK